MNYIIDKIVIFILCVTFYLFNITDTKRIIPILIVIIISAALSYFEKNVLKYIGVVAFVILCFYYSEFFFFIPVVFYDLILSKEKLLWTSMLVPIIISIGETSWINYVFISVFILLTLLLKFKTKRYIKLKDKYFELHDNSREMEIMLEVKNKKLMEQQDNEINIATLNERNRIARDIHDNVGHMLSRSILQIGALLAINKDENTKESLKTINESLSQAMTSIRNSVHDLHEQSIDLSNEIKTIITNFTFCPIELDYDIDSSIDKKLKYCFITVIKEALSNVIKHSDATKVSIILREHPALFQLVIHDNGTKYKAESSDGIGLTNIKDRVAAFNGNMNINTDKGFKIFISIPKVK